jgi:hypothetical protein
VGYGTLRGRDLIAMPDLMLRAHLVPSPQRLRRPYQPARTQATDSRDLRLTCCFPIHTGPRTPLPHDALDLPAVIIGRCVRRRRPGTRDSSHGLHIRATSLGTAVMSAKPAPRPNYKEIHAQWSKRLLGGRGNTARSL